MPQTPGASDPSVEIYHAVEGWGWRLLSQGQIVQTSSTPCVHAGGLDQVIQMPQWYETADLCEAVVDTILPGMPMLRVA